MNEKLLMKLLYYTFVLLVSFFIAINWLEFAIFYYQILLMAGFILFIFLMRRYVTESVNGLLNYITLFIVMIILTSITVSSSNSWEEIDYRPVLEIIEEHDIDFVSSGSPIFNDYSEYGYIGINDYYTNKSILLNLNTKEVSEVVHSANIKTSILVEDTLYVIEYNSSLIYLYSVINGDLIAEYDLGVEITDLFIIDGNLYLVKVHAISSDIYVFENDFSLKLVNQLSKRIVQLFEKDNLVYITTILVSSNDLKSYSINTDLSFEFIELIYEENDFLPVSIDEEGYFIINSYTGDPIKDLLLFLDEDLEVSESIKFSTHSNAFPNTYEANYCVHSDELYYYIAPCNSYQVRNAKSRWYIYNKDLELVSDYLLADNNQSNLFGANIIITDLGTYVLTSYSLYEVNAIEPVLSFYISNKSNDTGYLIALLIFPFLTKKHKWDDIIENPPTDKKE